MLSAYILLAALAPSSVNLLQFSVGGSSPNSAGATVCEATTTSQVSACISQMRSGLKSSTHIGALITCSLPNECAFDLSGFPTSSSAPSISIFGDGNGSSGFSRTADYSYAIFYLQNSKRISFSGLNFNDTTAEVASQESIFDISNSSDVTITGNSFVGAKRMAIAFNASTRILITNNMIDSSQLYGIWSGGPSTEIHIQGNTIKNSWANGSLTSIHNGKFVQNEYYNNHAKEPFGVTGGELDNEVQSNNIYIGCNLLHGNTTTGSPYASGIETASQHINNIEMVGNTIRDHGMYGVTINYNDTDMSNINIHNNTIVNNRVSPVSHSQIDYSDFHPTIANNCTDASCLVSCNTAIDWIFADGFQ